MLDSGKHSGVTQPVFSYHCQIGFDNGRITDQSPPALLSNSSDPKTEQFVFLKHTKGETTETFKKDPHLRTSAVRPSIGYIYDASRVPKANEVLAKVSKLI